MKLGKTLGQSQADAQSRIPCLRRVGAPEAVEHEGHHFTANARAGVSNFDVTITTDGTYGDLSATAAGRELDGVAQQVPYNLLQSPRFTEKLALGGL